MILTGTTGYSSRPIDSATALGDFSQATISLVKSGTQTVSVTTSNSTLNLNGMMHHVSPRISMAPNSMIESVAIQGHFVQPAHEASIDLANDGNIDWSFPSDPAYGSYGWQTRLYQQGQTATEFIRSHHATGNDSFSVLLPEGAIVTSIMMGISPISQTSPLAIMSGLNSIYQFSNNEWESTSFMVANPTINSQANLTDNTGRIWDIFEFDITTSTNTEYLIGSVSIGYELLENVSGLGQVVKTYHELNSNNGQISIVDVPLTWSASAGGVGIDGGVYHENMITNHPFTAPQTWYPNGEIQSFMTQHHHLYGNENIAEIHLSGTDSNGEMIEIVLSDIANGGTFTQNNGLVYLNSMKIPQ